VAALPPQGRGWVFSTRGNSNYGRKEESAIGFSLFGPCSRWRRGKSVAARKMGNPEKKDCGHEGKGDVGKRRVISQEEGNAVKKRRAGSQRGRCPMWGKGEGALDQEFFGTSGGGGGWPHENGGGKIGSIREGKAGPGEK